MNCDGAR